MNRTAVSRLSFAAALAVWPGSEVAAAALTNAVPSLAPLAPDLGASLIRLLGSLAIVLLVLLGGVWAFRNWQRIVLRKGAPAQLQVLEARQLGQRHALYVIDYRGQRMLIAASPNGVSLLSHLQGADAAPPVEAQAAPMAPEDFTSALRQALQARP